MLPCGLLFELITAASITQQPVTDRPHTIPQQELHILWCTFCGSLFAFSHQHSTLCSSSLNLLCRSYCPARMHLPNIFIGSFSSPEHLCSEYVLDIRSTFVLCMLSVMWGAAVRQLKAIIQLCRRRSNLAQYLMQINGLLLARRQECSQACSQVCSLVWDPKDQVVSDHKGVHQGKVRPVKAFQEVLLQLMELQPGLDSLHGLECLVNRLVCFWLHMYSTL